jgi:pyruvate formate lyase activating enzyme
VSEAGELRGLVFHIMRFSLHDGPGIRTTVFLKGCPLSCWWCHNPESQSPRPNLMYFEERCRRCGDCVAVCPQSAVNYADGRIGLPAVCEGCGACVEACVAGARELAGRRMAVSEVVREIERDVVFFDESRGGVTLSGGEPLWQPRFTEAVLAACRARRIHSVLDTCGLAEPEVALGASAHADLVLYDLKMLDAQKHAGYTGADNTRILRNLEALVAAGRAVRVRFPLIPGVNDDARELSELMRFLAGLGLRELDVLPYHRIGLDKYRRLGRSVRLPELAAPSAAQLEQVASQFEQHGFSVKIGG